MSTTDLLPGDSAVETRIPARPFLVGLVRVEGRHRLFVAGTSIKEVFARSGPALGLNSAQMKILIVFHAHSGRAMRTKGHWTPTFLLIGSRYRSLACLVGDTKKRAATKRTKLSSRSIAANSGVLEPKSLGPDHSRDHSARGPLVHCRKILGKTSRIDNFFRCASVPDSGCITGRFMPCKGGTLSGSALQGAGHALSLSIMW